MNNICVEGTSSFHSLRSIDNPIELSNFISKCLTIAGNDKKFVMYREIEAELNILMENKLLVMGSKSDCSDILQSDCDVLFIMDQMVQMERVLKDCKTQQECLIAELSPESPGFTKLFSLSCQCYITSKIEAPKFDTLALRFNSKGPSIQQISLEGMILGDTVLATPCSNWQPGTRDRWLQRPRSGWPSKGVVKDLSETMCVVVHVGRENSELSDLEWRFAFPFVERGLVWSFSNVQLQCFVLLKILNNTFLKKIGNEDDGISSFHIKMVMFWECENSDPKDWSEGNLIDCVCLCLRRLRLAIKNKELKHFIIEERNVIDTKLKNSETREKVINKIEEMESNIIVSIIQCITQNKTLLNSSKILELKSNEVTDSCLALIEKRYLIEIAFFTRQSVFFKTEAELPVILQNTTRKKESYPDKNGSQTMSIGNNINHIWQQVTRMAIAMINIRIGSIMLTKAVKDPEYRKNEILLAAKNHFEKGVDIDNMAGHLYLATFYLVCGKEYEHILTSIVTNKVLVCIPECTNISSILMSDGNSKLTFSKYSIPNGYALHLIFKENDLEIVPDVLKYELCSEYAFVCIHPFVYTKYLQICFDIKHKLQSSATRYIQELRQSLTLDEGKASDIYLYLNILAYCYRQIGLTNEGMYFYMASILCFPNIGNSALFHLAHLVNGGK